MPRKSLKIVTSPNQSADEMDITYEGPSNDEEYTNDSTTTIPIKKKRRKRGCSKFTKARTTREKMKIKIQVTSLNKSIEEMDIDQEGTSDNKEETNITSLNKSIEEMDITQEGTSDNEEDTNDSTTNIPIKKQRRKGGCSKFTKARTTKENKKINIQVTSSNIPADEIDITLTDSRNMVPIMKIRKKPGSTRFTKPKRTGEHKQIKIQDSNTTVPNEKKADDSKFDEEIRIGENEQIKIQEKEPTPIIVISESSNQNVRELTQGTESQSVYVIRGTICQDNVRFHQNSRNRQCTPIAVVALAYNRIFPFSAWNTQTINNILDYGDSLYRKSISTRILQNFANTSSTHPYLMLSEVYSKFIISTYGFELCYEENNCVDGRVGFENDGPFYKLADGLPQVFQNFDSAVFTCASLSICISRSSTDYYLFDSHSRGLHGRPVEYGGKACLIRFRNIDALLSFLLQNYPAEQQYSLSPIEVRIESAANVARSDTYTVLELLSDSSSPITPPVSVDFIQTAMDSLNTFVRQDSFVTLPPTETTTIVRDAAPQQPDVPLHYLGVMSVQCIHCAALFFDDENPICCSHGAVKITDGPDYPDLLKALITDTHPHSKGFIKNIRRYNTLLSIGSTTATIRKDLGQGAPVVVISGQIYHRVGDVSTRNPRFGSLYFIDSGEAKQARTSNAAVNVGCRPDLLEQIDELLRNTHPYAQMYRSLGQKVQDERRTHGSDRIPEIGLYFKTIPGTNRSVYAAPSTSEEIGAVFTSVDGNMPPPNDYIRVFYREGNVEYTEIPRLSPIVDALCYPLLFPHGELGWATNLLRSGGNDSEGNRKRISKREFDRYRLMSRYGKFNPILQSGKLSQQYIVDKFAELEGDRLFYLRLHQKDVRADTYVGLLDFIARKNATEPVESEKIGKVTVLPSSFHGGPRCMQQRYQDAMAIVAKLGRPSLFVTFTCNPNWREIRENLGGRLLNPQDRPELIARVFDLKRRALFEDVLKNKIFGTVIAHVYVVEFQKRGLPHLHWLLFLAEEDKLREPDDVDRLICAELPAANGRLFDIIMASMIHGPCGDRCQNSPCMEDGACSKHYPKEFAEHTVIDQRRPIYRRRNDGRTATLIRHGTSYTVDNRDVVPYSPYLCMKYESHINVEVVTSVAVVKYVFKYINKGPDAAVIQAKNELIFDEITAYIESRYLSAGEAAFRLLAFSTHGNRPTVIQLPVHLPGEQQVQFDQGQEEQAVRRTESKLSYLEAFFELNVRDPDARKHLYCSIPQHYCWVNGKWRKRRNSYFIVTRMFTISPKYAEKFHLRILLTHVRGPKSFEEIRTYGGIVYSTFQEAARMRLLISSDDEWEKTLEHASLVEMPKCMRKLFAYMLCFCEIGNPLALWTAFKCHMCEDFRMRGCSTADAENRALRGIETILGYQKRKLGDFNLPECIIPDDVNNDVVVEDDDDLMSNTTGEFDSLSLNSDQRGVFDRITASTTTSASFNRYFYLQGSGGTGKTHLYNTILKFFGERQVATVAVAFTGIAAVLLLNGRTVHSTFRLPLSMDADSRSAITAQSEEAAALRMLRLMIWDEVSMASFYVLDAVDRLLQDVRNDCRPFGGICVLLRGDVKQLLPVAAGRVRQVELFFANCQSWHQFEVLRLNVNMRTDTGELEFAAWLEQLGQGTLNEKVNDSEDIVHIPDRCLTLNVIGDIYGSISSLTTEQLAARAILCPKNEHCNTLNDRILESFPGRLITLLSSDSVASGDEVEMANYQMEYLNSITPSGMPHHELKLKVGVPVILLRNLSLEDGLINGTRLLVLSTTEFLITAKIVTGRFVRRTVLIPRMDLTSSDKTIPIILKRRQFPVKVCFALTINKAQGQTFDKVGIYLGTPVFSHGQLYVAFSRARNWDSVKVQVEETRHQGRLLKSSKNVYTKNIVYGSILNFIK